MYMNTADWHFFHLHFLRLLFKVKGKFRTWKYLTLSKIKFKPKKKPECGTKAKRSGFCYSEFKPKKNVEHFRWLVVKFGVFVNTSSEYCTRMIFVLLHFIPDEWQPGDFILCAISMQHSSIYTLIFNFIPTYWSNCKSLNLTIFGTAYE